MICLMDALVMLFGNVDFGRSPSITIKPISSTLDQRDNFALSELNFLRTLISSYLSVV
jgi:hypothetical protein